jgi:very-short-patch-repair endonuclease
MAPSTIRRRVESREWRVIFPGVYRHIGTTVDDLLVVNAARLWLGPSAVLSGSWAAWWHELRPDTHGPIVLTMPRGSSYRAHPHARVRRRDIAQADIAVVRGVSVTSRPLTALENVILPAGDNVFDRALQRHVAVPDLVQSMVRFRGATGATAARERVQEAEDGTVSAPERELAAAMRKAGLNQVKAGVHVQAGGRRFWLDFAVAELKLAIEVDGVSAHTDPTVFHADRERQNALILDGWTVLRFTPWQIRHQLDSVLAQICAALAQIG